LGCPGGGVLAWMTIGVIFFSNNVLSPVVQNVTVSVASKIYIEQVHKAILADGPMYAQYRFSRLCGAPDALGGWAFYASIKDAWSSDLRLRLSEGIQVRFSVLISKINLFYFVI
jgi:hypothetical protein